LPPVNGGSAAELFDPFISSPVEGHRYLTCQLIG
jgi:hypothetical protein